MQKDTFLKELVLKLPIPSILLFGSWLYYEKTPDYIFKIFIVVFFFSVILGLLYEFYNRLIKSILEEKDKIILQKDNHIDKLSERYDKTHEQTNALLESKTKSYTSNTSQTGE